MIPFVAAGTTAALQRHVAEAPSLVERAQKYAADAFAFYERFLPSSIGWHPAKQFYRV